MTRTEFLKELEDQLGLPGGTLVDSQRLDHVEGWDSMAAVIFMAVADEKMGVAVSGDQIAKAKTVDDLLSLLGETLTA